MELEIVNTALENLKKITGITCNWVAIAQKNIDGKLKFKIYNKEITFWVEEKKELRNHQLPVIRNLANKYEPLIVVAERIFPKVKEELRQQKIAYLEANGNIYIQRKDIFIWLDNQKPIPVEKEKTNRAFTKTGLKLIFQLLINEDLLNLPYREMAKQTGLAFTNLPYIINGLKVNGYILQIDNRKKKLNNKDKLIRTWVERYEDKLKPDLHIGTFRFADNNQFKRWKDIQLKNKDTVWGGEPAAALLTKYLNPEILTLYTTATKIDLLKNYKLIPDTGGYIKIYKKFWEVTNFDNITAPAFLIYADLINSGDSRNIETAKIIYNEYIKNKY
jgi:hypothetical protein